MEDDFLCVQLVQKSSIEAVVNLFVLAFFIIARARGQ
jgi:hypothetical protein